MQDLTAELRDKIVVTYALSCLWFLPAQAVNFMLVPARSGPPQIVSKVWITVLTHDWCPQVPDPLQRSVRLRVGQHSVCHQEVGGAVRHELASNRRGHWQSLSM